MAGEGGFEPPNGGSKDRCLTTWRLPIGVFGEHNNNTPTRNLISRKMTTMTRARATLAALLFFASLNLHAANVKATGRVVGNEIKRYARDAKSLAAAPLHWNAARWRKAAMVTAGLAATMLLDDEI